MKYNIPLALLAAARTLAEGVDAAFTVMPRSLISSHFCSDLPAASSGRAIRRSGYLCTLLEKVLLVQDECQLNK